MVEQLTPLPRRPTASGDVPEVVQEHRKEDMKDKALHTTLFCAALFFALYVLHSASFHAPFYFDSIYHIEEKTNLKMTEFSVTALLEAMRSDVGSEKIYRPISGISLAMTHYFFGLSTWAYRAGNLLIHFLASLALLFLFMAVLESPKVRARAGDMPGGPLIAAMLGVALWSLHPVHTNVISYVIQRMASLSGLFVFLAVGCYIRGRSVPSGWSWGWALLALLATFLGIASKENAAITPLLLLVAEWVLLVPPAGRKERRILFALAGVAALGIATLSAIKGPPLWETMQKGYALRDFTMGERLLTQAVLQVRYLTVLLVPDYRILTIDADVPISRGLMDPPETLGSLALVTLALFLALLVRRKRPLLALSILWFFAAQAVEGTILALELYFEHRMYVPSVFLYLGIAVLALRAATWRVLARRTAVAVLVLFLAAECFATHRRTSFWANPILLYDDVVAKSPGNGRAYVNLGHWLIEYRRYEEAAEALDLAEKNGGDPELIAFNRGVIAFLSGDLETGRDHMNRVLEMGGSQAWRALRNLAYDRYLSGIPEEAELFTDTALGIKPSDPDLLLLQSKLLLAKGDHAGAHSALQKSLRHDAFNPDTWAALGEIALSEGKTKEAAQLYKKAVALDVSNAVYRSVYEGLLRELEKTLE